MKAEGMSSEFLNPDLQKQMQPARSADRTGPSTRQSWISIGGPGQRSANAGPREPRRPEWARPGDPIARAGRAHTEFRLVRAERIGESGSPTRCLGLADGRPDRASRAPQAHPFAPERSNSAARGASLSRRLCARFRENPRCAEEGETFPVLKGLRGEAIAEAAWDNCRLPRWCRQDPDAADTLSKRISVFEPCGGSVACRASRVRGTLRKPAFASGTQIPGDQKRKCAEERSRRIGCWVVTEP